MHKNLVAVATLMLVAVTLQGCGPTPAPSPGPAPPTPVPTPACLCVFDIDRTLTGKQGSAASCPTDQEQGTVRDCAYSQGKLLLSEIMSSGLGSTFCHECYIGIISAGGACGPGSPERGVLFQKLSEGTKLPANTTWNPPGCVVKGSPFVTDCPDRTKQNSIPGIQDFYKTTQNVDIADSDVHFFDDRIINIEPFKGLGYNARQISCDSRDGELGLCGAKLSEIKKVSGVATCSGNEDYTITV